MMYRGKSCTVHPANRITHTATNRGLRKKAPDAGLAADEHTTVTVDQHRPGGSGSVRR